MKRKIVQAEVDGKGKVYFAFPLSAMLSIEAAEIVKLNKEGPRRTALIEMAMVADCLVDVDGKRRFDGYNAIIEGMSAEEYNAISAEFREAFTAETKPAGDAEKNSESITDSLPPTSSPES
jgi:hypothetical protein